MHHYDTLDNLDALIQSRSILRHPFYVAWQQGDLTREQLATYARIYWPHVCAFPSYLESAAEKTDDPMARATLEDNLDDERSNPKPHPELWLDFAQALGQQRQTVIDAETHHSAARMVETFTRLARASTAEGVAALYAYESQQPIVSSQKRDGLCEYYGIDSEPALAYFDVHAKADVLHSQGERDVLQRCLDNGVDPATILRAANEALNAYWGLLDGVCEAADITTA
jgi:pyrroloquinoline-quinone synthase